MSAERGERAPQPRGSHPLLLGFALFGGTSAWTVHLIGSYAVANYFCGDAFVVPFIFGLTALTMLVAAASTILSIRILRRPPRDPERGFAPAPERDHFLASGGIVLGGLALMAMALGIVGTVGTGCVP